MNTFWKNINQFPRFLISVFAGFFLTTFHPIFELLKNKKKRILITILLLSIILITFYILSLMLGLNEKK